MLIENINDAHFIKQNDTLTEIHFKVVDALEVPIDLTAFEKVEVIVGNEVGRFLTKVPELLAGIGEMSFTLDKDDIIPSGKQWLEIHMYNAEGLRHVAPSKGFYPLRVERPIDEIQAEVTTVTLDYLLGVITEKAVAGPQGPQGIQGPQGPVGPQGERGVSGPQGIQGIKGDQGPKGDKGDKGSKGDAGSGVNILGSLTDESQLPLTGTSGDAYLINGNLYVWAETLWENVGNIQGPQGEQGEQGPQGEAGPQGEKGVDGETVERHQDIFVATEGQTLFTLSKSYLVGNNRLDVNYGGVPQYTPNNFTETSENSFTLLEGATEGTLVVATYFTKSVPLGSDLEVIVNGHTESINALETTMSAETLRIDAHDARLTNLESGSAVVSHDVSGLNREVAYLKLRQAANERIEGGTVFAEDMNGNRFGMTLDEVNSRDFTIRDGKLLLLGEDTVNHNVTDATVVNGTGYDVSGNGGRKLVRLNNSWLVAVVRSSDTLFFYVNKNNGSGFVRLCWKLIGLSAIDVSIAVKENIVHTLYSYPNGNNSGVGCFNFDATTIQDVNITASISPVDNTQTALGNVSLTINEAKTELHATWASKNATYPNSFNIRYAKGVIQPDGSVVWGAVEQLTAFTTTGFDVKNPSVIVDSKNNPVIVFDGNHGTSLNKIYALLKVNGVWSLKEAYTNNGYAQSNPSAIFVPKSINGLANGRIWVAWHGYDSVDNVSYNIRVSYSDDGGATWSAMQKLTSGNTTQFFTSITADRYNNIYLTWSGMDASVGPFRNIRMVKHDGSWGTITAVTNHVSGHANIPSCLFDLTLDVNSPLFIYLSLQNNKIGFYGTWSEQVEVPRLSATAVYDLPTTDHVGAFVEKIGSVDVQAYLNDELMTSSLEGSEYLFEKTLSSKVPVKMRLELSRASVDGGENDAITRILGGRS